MFVSSDTEANSSSYAEGSEDHKHQRGKERASVFLRNYMPFLEKALRAVRIQPERGVHRLGLGITVPAVRCMTSGWAWVIEGKVPVPSGSA